VGFKLILLRAMSSFRVTFLFTFSVLCLHACQFDYQTCNPQSNLRTTISCDWSGPAECPSGTYQNSFNCQCSQCSFSSEPQRGGYGSLTSAQFCDCSIGCGSQYLSVNGTNCDKSQATVVYVDYDAKFEIFGSLDHQFCVEDATKGTLTSDDCNKKCSSPNSTSVRKLH